jgi:filamentous hemagglutinin family protein
LFHITQSLGRLSGGNLFFSFQYFNITAGETALFTTASPGISNIISRVTGGYATTIGGNIVLLPASGDPNFFFVNPAGVTFTSHAIVDIPASFAVTTANYLKFSNGNFYADAGKTSTLSAKAPEAFGFLGTTRAPVNVDGATLYVGLTTGAQVQIVAGDITVDGGGGSAAINAVNGTGVRIIATGSQAAEVPLTGTFQSVDGSINLLAGGAINTSGFAAGGIYASAGTLRIDGTNAGYNVTGIGSVGNYGGDPIHVDVSGSAVITNGGYIQSATADGTGASITLNAGTLSIQGQNSVRQSLVASNTFGTGSAGSIDLNATGAVSIVNGGLVSAQTNGAGTAGSVALRAESLTIDGGTSAETTGIERFADDSAASNGQVSITLSGPMTMSHGGAIQSDTFTSGNAGNVRIVAGSLSMDGNNSSISSSSGTQDSDPGASLGNAGQVSITTRGATILTNGASIEASTDAEGNAGDVTIDAGSLLIEGATPVHATGIFTSAYGLTGNGGQVTVSAGSLTINNGGISSKTNAGASGTVTVDVTGAGSISDGGYISTATNSAANAGNVTVNAGSLDLDGGNSTTAFTGISSSNDRGATGNAGMVSVTTAGATTVADGAEIESSAFGAGSAGSVTLRAGSLDVDGAGTSSFYTGIFTTANNVSSGSAGQIAVTTSGATVILNSGEISSDTYGAGTGGSVSVTAASLRIDGGVSPYFTGISSQAEQRSSGNGGRVSITTSGATTLSDGAQISASTSAAGNAGDVNLDTGTLTITGSPTTGLTAILSAANSGSTGNGGRIVIATGAATLAGGGSIESGTGGTGNAGQISVTSASTLSIAGGARIESNTYSAGNAGDVSIDAGSLSIDGTPTLFTGISSSAEPLSSGNAGQVSITTSGATTILDSGQILSATFAAGNAGDVSLKAGSLTLEGGTPTLYSNISTTADTDSSGAAGLVKVDVTGTVTLMSYGEISSAARGADGQPGSVAIDAGKLVMGDNALVSIKNSSTIADPAQVSPTRIGIDAASIQMTGAKITAESTGNIAASSIDISYVQTLHLDPSSISTTSNQGNGGPITISGMGPLWLENSSITTSVLGTTNGNGGDIRITAPDIVLDTAVIQANTKAPHASGGDVVITSQALIPSYQSYVLGGSLVTFDPATLGLNVVQAAAPDGISGTLDVTVPTLDLGNALVGLTGTPSTPIALSRTPCTYREGSSLSVAGRGGLPVSHRDPLWIGVGATSPTASRGTTAPGDVPDLPWLASIACR